MDFINGEDRILYIKYNGVYMPVGCLTGNGITEDVEMIDTTTRDNKGWKTQKPLVQSYSVSFSGVQINTTVVGGNFGIASYDKLVTLKRNKLLLEWKLQGSKYPVVDYGFAHITTIESSENVGEFMSFSGTLQGFGIPLTTSLGTTLLNNGDPNTVIQTNASGNELLRTGKF